MTVKHLVQDILGLVILILSPVGCTKLSSTISLFRGCKGIGAHLVLHELANLPAVFQNSHNLQLLRIAGSSATHSLWSDRSCVHSA